MKKAFVVYFSPKDHKEKGRTVACVRWERKTFNVKRVQINVKTRSIVRSKGSPKFLIGGVASKMTLSPDGLLATFD